MAAAKTPPSVIVIFGAAGDLTGRKLVPALYHLASQELLADEFAMIGIDRADMDSQAYRDGNGAETEKRLAHTVDSVGCRIEIGECPHPYGHGFQWIERVAEK